MILRYYLPDQGMDPDDAYEFASRFHNTGDYEIDDIDAGDAADDFHSNHDGWECTWPKVFAIKGCSEPWKFFLVSRDIAPVFTAREQPNRPESKDGV